MRMGSSYTEYRGAGFWTKDDVIQYLLFAVSREVRDASSPPGWMDELCSSWQKEATRLAGGDVDAQLDAQIASETRVNELTPHIVRAVDRLKVLGEFIPSDELAANRISGYGPEY